MHLDDVGIYVEQWVKNQKSPDLIGLKTWFGQTLFEGWEYQVRFDNKNYCRHIIHSCDSCDVVLICWMPGQGSPAHGHPANGCLVKVLRGKLEDELITQYTSVRNKYKTDDVLYINDEMGLHRVFNASDLHAISLHIYSPGAYKPD